MKNAVPSVETAPERGASSLGFCYHRPERGKAAVPLLPLSIYVAVVWKRPEPDVVSNRSIVERERVNRSAAERKGSPGCRPGSGSHLLISVRGSGIPPRVGKPGEAHLTPRWIGMPRLGVGGNRLERERCQTPAPQQCPLRTPSGEQRSILLVDPTRAAVWRAALDPVQPVPGPGTGPSRFLGRETLEKA